MRGVAVKTPERVAEAQRMRAEGMLLREIGAHFGVSTKTIDGWLHDADGVKQATRTAASAERCAGTCKHCGAATTGSRGRANAPERCRSCAYEEDAVWTRAALIFAIQEWAHEHGEPPAMHDWNPHTARHYLHDETRARRFEEADGAWPWCTYVVRVFGTWNAGIEAAGFAPRATGGGDGNQARLRSVRERATVAP